MCAVQYEEGSAPALALDATIERTDKRFDGYAKTGVLCGSEGLPHLISDPGFALRYGHAGEIFVRFPFCLCTLSASKCCRLLAWPVQSVLCVVCSAAAHVACA